jgi:predicted metal-binding protein
MKKLGIAVLILFATAIVLSSCQSARGPKCPGMYSKIQKTEQQKPM